MSVLSGKLLNVTRHTTFKFCLDPTLEQCEVLARHAGASRFAFNQCLGLVKATVAERKSGSDVALPWSGFDLINAFNDWKSTEDAGRIFSVNSTGQAVLAIGLPWQRQVCQQVFEEAAVDCGRALAAWSDSRSGNRRGPRVGFPRFKKKTGVDGSFRLRNKNSKGRLPAIRVGTPERPRSVILPGIGHVNVHDDTRRLRRMLRNGRAKILAATVCRRSGRWWVALNLEAADIHPAHRHSARNASDENEWVGLDRGLSAFVVGANEGGQEVMRILDPPKALVSGLKRQRRFAKSLSRKQKGSKNRRDAAAKLARHHFHVANVRRHFLHKVSNELVKTHEWLVVEDLNVSGMLANRRLARSISDAAWGEFARIVSYKQLWRGGTMVMADRWFPSSKLCASCGVTNSGLRLSDRVFSCTCGYRADRDANAAVNLARWGRTHHDSLTEPRTPKHRGRVIKARRREGADRHIRVPVKPARTTREPTFKPHQWPELGTPEEGAVEHSSVRRVR
jgi:putative transposase